METVCPHCVDLGAPIKQYNGHESAKHIEFHRRQINMITALMEEGNNVGNESSDVSKLCKAIVKYHNWKKYIVCRECEKNIQVGQFTRKQGNHHMISNMINHVCFHLGKPIYSCRYCKWGSISICVIANHLKTRHGLSLTRNYIDSSSEYESEIVQMLEWCFGRNQVRPRNMQSKLRNRLNNYTLNENRNQSSVLIDTCGEILANRNSKEPLICRECKKELQSFDGLHGKCAVRRMVDHVSIHLGKTFFSCRHCNFKFTSRNSVNAHLQRKHNLHGTADNFADSRGEHEMELVEMLKWCYGNKQECTVRPDVAKNINGTRVKESQRNQVSKMTPAEKVCRKIFTGWKYGNHVYCVKCGHKAIVFDKNGALRMKYLLDHARGHLGKPMFTCQFCDHSSATVLSIARHLRLAHQSKNPVQYYQCNMDYDEEVMEMMKMCFGHGNDEKPSVPSIRCRVMLLETCRNILQFHENKKSLMCRECNKEINMTRFYQISNSMIEHARDHFGKPVLSCQLCWSKFATKPSLDCHLARTHQTTPNPTNYVDKTSDYQEEIIETVEWCFGQKKENGVKPAMAPKRTQLAKRYFGVEGQQTIDIHLRNYFLDHFGQRDPKAPLVCLQCNFSISVWKKESFFPDSAIRHAMSHLRRPLFTCKHCEYVTSSRSGIRRHLNRAHGISKYNGQYKDNREKYKDAMADIIKDCFFEKTKRVQIRKRRQFCNGKQAVTIACRALFMDFESGDHVTCAECGQKLTVFSQTTGSVKSYNLIEHARQHLGKILFVCQYCNHGTRTRCGIIQHVTNVHKVYGSQRHYTNKGKSPDSDKEIIDMLKKCFQRENDQTTENKTQRKTSILNLCRELRELNNWKRGDHARCTKCNTNLAIFSRAGTFSSFLLVDHARVHVGKRPYLCNCCNYASATRDRMNAHLKKIHRLNGSPKNYKCTTSVFDTEVIDMIKECFGPGNNEANASTKKIRLKHFNSGALSDKCHSVLDDQNKKKRVICRICKKGLTLFSRPGGSVHIGHTIDHVCRHLAKPVYLCKHCKCQLTSEGEARRHLKRNHGLSGIKENCIDWKRKYEAEMMRMIEKCFSKKPV